jgi:transposase
MTEQEYTFWVGIDWATEAHQVCVIDGDRNVLAEVVVEHQGEAIAKFADDLIAKAGGAPASIAVAIETPRGAILETLMDRGIAVFAINPKQLDRFRDRHTVAGAKDDRRDAYVLAHSLRTDRPCFRRVRTDDPRVVEIRELVRMHEDLTKEVTALGNRLREQVHRFFPQVLALGSVYDDAWIWDLLELVPTPTDVPSLAQVSVDAILKAHKIRRLNASRVLDTLRATPLHVAPGVAAAARRHIAMLLPRLRLAHAQRRQCIRELDKLLDDLEELPSRDDQGPHRDARILRSWPGLGTLISATMLAEGGQALAERDYQTLRAQCGTAPVTRQSGKKATVAMRYACNPRLREAIYHWARNSLLRDPKSKTHYAALRAKGHSHGRALRGVADRLLSVLVAMLTRGCLYDASLRAAA